MTRTELYTSSIDYFLRPIAELIRDDDVTEIMINGPDEIRAERDGRIVTTDLKFPGPVELSAAVRNIAEYNERHLDDLQLTMDGHLPDGSRIHVIMPPAAKDVHVTIRKFNKKSFNLQKLVKCGSLSTAAPSILIPNLSQMFYVVNPRCSLNSRITKAYKQLTSNCNGFLAVSNLA